MAETSKQAKNGNHYRSLDDLEGTRTSDIHHPGTLCGCGSFTPAFLQRFSRPLVFTAHAGIILAIFMCAITYSMGIITTIERQFQLSSSEVAALSVLNDVSSLGLIIFVTYYGHTSHRPRLIAAGSIIVAISFIFCALPHFLSETIDTQSFLAGGLQIGHQNSSARTGVCQADSNMAPNSYEDISKNSSDPCVQESKSTGIGPVKWLVIGQVIMGVGSSIFPLTLSYIDDAVKAHKFTSYTAFLFIAVLLGPIVGFFLTSKATSLYVDFDRIPADQIPDIHQYDPRWIGAWWLFFPVFSILLFVAALPMFLYPKVMTSKAVESCGVDEDAEKEDDKDALSDTASIQMAGAGRIFADTSGGIIQSFKGLFLAIKRLLTNLPLMLMCFGATAETAIGVIQSTFQVKYYQTQFGTSPATAAALMGGLIVPMICVGQVVSAVICRRFKLDTKQCVLLIVFCHAFALFIGIATLFIGCSDFPVAGINSPYPNDDVIPTDQPNGVSITQIYKPILQLESTCNVDCACPDEIFQPVCGANGVSYISPCHAGCTEEMTSNNDSTSTKYTNCACISAKQDESFTGDTAVSGMCRDHCDSTQQLTILMAVGVLGAFVMSLTFNPLMFVIFRLVDPEDRSISLGFQSVITKCLGYFPAPIIMGMLINSTCTLWQYTCGDRGSCWLYDILAYRYLFVGVTIALKVISLIAHTCVYISIKPTKGADEQIDMKDINGKSTAV